MNKAIAAFVLAAGLAGCDNTPVTQQPTWRLTRDGVVLQRAGKAQTIDLPGWVWVHAPYCPPDLAVGPKGEAVVTSNVISILWRVDPQTLAVTVHPLTLSADTDKDVGFSGLVYSAEHGAFFAMSDAHRSLWRIDPNLMTGQKLGTSPDWKANFRVAQRLSYARGAACGDLS